MEHVRIDEGIPRKQRRQKPADIERRARNEAGQFLSTYTPELKAKAIEQGLVALECGARVEEVADRLNIPRATMYSWLIGIKADKARTLFFDGQCARSLAAMEVAATPLDLTRERELLAGWVKVAERRDPKSYAQKQEVTHNLPDGPLILIGLAPGVSSPERELQAEDVALLPTEGGK